MTSGSEFSHSFEMSELIDAASAVAERQLQDVEASQRLATELTGQTAPQMPLELRHKLVTATAALNIAKIENPDTQLGFEDSLDAIMDGSYEDMAELFGDGEGEVSTSQIREFMLSFGKTLMAEVGITDEQIAEDFTKRFQAAKTIADEKGVSVAQVYRNEELYSEAHRRAYTPEEFANREIRSIESVSEKTTNALAVNLLSAMIPEEEQAQMSEEEMAELMAEFQLDPEVQAAIRQATEIGVKVAKQLATSQIIRFWGTDTLHNLSAEMQDKLGVTESKATQIGGFVLERVSVEQADTLRMRDDFAARYFKERDWDIDNPSIEQLTEVRSQPGWQNPSL